MEMPGRVVGMYNRSPSFNGGMNSEPRWDMGYQVPATHKKAIERVVFLQCSTTRIRGR